MANSVAPDSWEQQADCGDTNSSKQEKSSVENKFSTLNVNAAEFVPSFCVNSTSTQNKNLTGCSENAENNAVASDSDDVLLNPTAPETSHGLL